MYTTVRVYYTKNWPKVGLYIYTDEALSAKLVRCQIFKQFRTMSLLCKDILSTNFCKQNIIFMDFTAVGRKSLDKINH